MTKRIQELDAFRGIAALMVVSFHYVMYTEFKNSPFILGVTGVDLFYLISGYVILLTAIKAPNWKAFVVSRFSRLYPPFWAAMLFTTILYLLFHRDAITLKMILGNITMIPHIIGVDEIDHSYWSLAVEIVFYAVILTLYITKQIKNIELWVAAGLLFLFTYHFITPLVHAERILFKIAYRIEFLNQAPLFFAGIIFYKLHQEGPKWYRHVLIVASAVLMYFMHAKGRALEHISYQQHGWMLAIYFGMFYLFIYGYMQWVVNKATIFLGKISYSLYLIHQYFSLNVLIPFFRNQVGLSHVQACLLSFSVVLITSAVFALYVEYPLHDRVRAYLKPKETAVVNA